MKKFYGHHMLSVCLSVCLSLLADADPESFDSDNVFFIYIFHVVLVDEGREDPNTTKAGRHRPASETPFDGLGSSRGIGVKIV